MRWRAARFVPSSTRPASSHGAAADLQLCAQALCLEEMLEVEIPHGYVWYGGPRRRLRVDFTAALRANVREVIDAIRTQLLTFELPAGAQRCQMHRVPAPAPLPAGTLECTAQGEPVHGERCVPMRYLSTVYVRNHRARVQHRRGSLVVSSPEGSQRVPLEAVDALVVLGGAQITTQALDACVRQRRSRGRAPDERRHPLRRERPHQRQRALADCSVRGGHGRESVTGCGQGDRRGEAPEQQPGRRPLVPRRERPRLRRSNSRPEARRYGNASRDWQEAETADHVRGVEGDAARIYFRAVAQAVASSELEFSGRTRRPPRDPVNALLGFCYGMLVTECIGAAESVGLDYQMGFLHRPRSGRPSLALDLAEEFRALTDRFVVSLVRRRQVGPGDFDHTPGGGVYLSDGGRTRLDRGMGGAQGNGGSPPAFWVEPWNGGRSRRSRLRSLPATCAAICQRILRSYWRE